jgi:uncharacterized protein (UPF0276 family)
MGAMTNKRIKTGQMIENIRDYGNWRFVKMGERRFLNKLSLESSC